MKLNVAESNLSHGLTAVVTTPKQATPDVSSTSLPSARTHLLSTGTQTDPPPIRQCPTTILYLLGALLMLLLPFALPVAITQAVRLLEAERVPDSREHSLRGIAHQQTGGEHASRQTKDDWSRWAAVRNGRLYVSETFENRLNEHAGLLYARLGERFKRRCAGGADVGFALNRGDGIQGWVEVTMRCGRGSCVRKASVDDIRKLVVGVEDGKHFVSAGGRVWGPLQGPLKVGLDSGAALALRRMCDGAVDRVFVGVDEIRAIVGVAVDVFRLDAGPSG